MVTLFQSILYLGGQVVALLQVNVQQVEGVGLQRSYVLGSLNAGKFRMFSFSSPQSA